MATTAPAKPETKISAEEAVDQLYQIIEGMFDEQGLSGEQRDERYARLDKHLDAKGVAAAKL
jgi:hypothetical protein